MTRAISVVLATAAAALITNACAGVGVPATRTSPPPPGASLWIEPTDLADRDLFYGPWGKDNAPDPDDVYRLIVRKHSGVNLGMTVKDAQHREWSVKQPFPGGLDPEGQVEVVVSRLLSAIGYHQPPIYYLPAFKLKDDFGTRVVVGGRFRLKDKAIKEIGNWRWEENPFVGTRAFQGLIVLLTMFNSTDLKNSNNSIYEYKNGDLVEQWYLPRDIGAALGDVNLFAPRKGDIDSFERSPFIRGVEDGHVQFAYGGWYKNLVRDRITPEEVAWASALLGRLSDQQFADAFRAGGYQPAVANRFIATLREKIEQGRELATRAANEKN